MALAMFTTDASAHPMAPSVLRLAEQPDGAVSMFWRTPVARAVGTDLEPVLDPARCRPVGQPTSTLADGGAALERRRRFDCGPEGIVGLAVSVAGLQSAPTNVVVMATRRDGGEVSALLDADQPRLVIPAARGVGEQLVAFGGLGMTHLWGGWDHVLFVLGLLVIVRGRRLVIAVTAFTVGHSVTLGLAAAGVVSLPQAPVEVAIALSLVALGVEAARAIGSDDGGGWVRRWPWLICGGFGLLHGLGFAGAFATAGVPADDLPVALLGFNLGIEVAQLALIGVAAAAYLGLSRLRGRPPTWLVPVAAHVVGSLGAYAVLDRLLSL